VMRQAAVLLSIEIDINAAFQKCQGFSNIRHQR
jgi:hypothetical protein